MNLEEQKAESLRRFDEVYENELNSLSWFGKWLHKGSIGELEYILYRQLISDTWDDTIKLCEDSDEKKQTDEDAKS